MRAIRFDESGKAQVVDIPKPLAGRGEVVVQVTSTGVCGSDLAALRGTHPFRVPPLISGHEAGGRIAEIGPGVDGLALGDRVVIDPQRSCGECALCTGGRYHLCASKQMLGIAEWDGSFAEFTAVPASTVIPAPDGVADEHLALAEPIAVAAHAVAQLGDRERTRSLVLGGGTIGALVARVVRDSGAEVLDVIEPRSHVHPMLESLGATGVHTPDAELESHSYDAVFVAAGVPALLERAFAAVAPGGAIVQVAVFGKPVPVPVGELQVREIALLGTAMYTKTDFTTALDVLDRHPGLADAIVSRTTSLEEGAEITTRMAADGPGDIVKLVMVP
ncbi:zinc-dependent alcohol dehydrogenase [Pseudoclavibacter terrae]|uniref:Alcohol dehydrogenase catalytic domain-containing protein n=1 Tax=Pseudoclavibacter terrae TaxID=1530195 RepID=A0A7J5B128_9MICO|nr:alcohol dehydrogenase catalytic domain-containing protein [Pseudoclavibacter terrae]KAB1637532.1 alcohol dehydrogenase catalytic domain-containing protein [Pseudoclavibacter terrae]